MTALAWLIQLVALRMALWPGRCASRHWGPYEDASGFGYAEWRCDLRRGHRPDHFSAYPGFR